VKAPANVNEALLVEPLLDRVLGEDIELELIENVHHFKD